MRILYFFIGILCATSTYGQNKQLLYGLDSQPQALMSNPGAAITFEKHIGIPFLSGFSVNAGSSGVSVFDIFREGGDINTAINDAVFTLTDKDFFTVHQELEIFSFGWKSQRSEIYYSGGVYQEFDVLAYYPRDLALLAYRGNADFIGIPFDFSDLSFTAEALTVYHFGINKKVSETWQLGARFKIYSSIANVNSTSNRGDFVTQRTPGGPNFFEHSIRDAVLRANTSGLAFLFDSEVDSDAGNFVKGALLGRNLGVGLDLGFTHFLNDRWSLTGSVIDLGYIAHRKDVRNYEATSSFTTSGIELEFSGIIDGVEQTDAFQELQDEFEDAIIFEDELEENYTTGRPTKINASVDYGFGRDFDEVCNCLNKESQRWKNKTGLQLYSIKRPKGFQSAVTAYFDRSWGSALRTKFTYTYDAFSATNFGALVSTKIYNFNLYLAADNLFELPNVAKAHSASLQLGMQLVFDPK